MLDPIIQKAIKNPFEIKMFIVLSLFTINGAINIISTSKNTWI
jgi:hypothetical protein